MIVPTFWAEARRQQRETTRQVTVRRFGWSDVSADDAQAMAEARVEAALAQVLAGKTTKRREPKVAYNGADGVPIREEVLARHGAAVITRNGYGARCLNTPDALFADVDFPVGPPLALRRVVLVVLAVLALLLARSLHWHPFGTIGAGLLAWWGIVPIATRLHGWAMRGTGGPERATRRRVTAFLHAHPDWSLRIYRTPAGLRLLATHAPLRPSDDAVLAFFDAVQADPIYVRMCRHQHCFRARLSAKPWRVGIEKHLGPRPGVWPLRPEWLPARERWVADYEARAAGYAACAFVEEMGTGRMHPALAGTVALHDAQCRATTPGLPIA